MINTVYNVRVILALFSKTFNCLSAPYRKFYLLLFNCIISSEMCSLAYFSVIAQVCFLFCSLCPISSSCCGLLFLSLGSLMIWDSTCLCWVSLGKVSFVFQWPPWANMIIICSQLVWWVLHFPPWPQAQQLLQATLLPLVHLRHQVSFYLFTRVPTCPSISQHLAWQETPSLDCLCVYFTIFQIIRLFSMAYEFESFTLLLCSFLKLTSLYWKWLLA